jgi:hypothetical protein
MNPLKVFVYLAFGVPVVATDIDGIQAPDHLVSLAMNHELFLSTVNNKISMGRLSLDESHNYVEMNNWEKRLKKHLDSFFSYIAR